MATEQDVANALTDFATDFGTLSTDLAALLKLATQAQTNPALLGTLVTNIGTLKGNVDSMKASIEAVTNPAPVAITVASVGSDAGGAFIVPSAPISALPADQAPITDSTSSAATTFVLAGSTTSKLYVAATTGFNAGDALAGLVAA